MGLNFELPLAKVILIEQIAERADREIFQPLGSKQTSLDTVMDLGICITNGCPLDLDRLLAAEGFYFYRDIMGIYRHLNRLTGKLEDGFLPRYAVKLDAPPAMRKLAILGGIPVASCPVCPYYRRFGRRAAPGCGHPVFRLEPFGVRELPNENEVDPHNQATVAHFTGKEIPEWCALDKFDK